MKSNQEKRQYWQEQVQAYENSGMTRFHYCEQNRIRLYQLDYWRKKIHKANAKVGPSKTWIPLQIRDDQTVQSTSGICLRIGRLAIEVKPGFDRDLLADVLRVVGPVC